MSGGIALIDLIGENIKGFIKMAEKKKRKVGPDLWGDLAAHIEGALERAGYTRGGAPTSAPGVSVNSDGTLIFAGKEFVEKGTVPEAKVGDMTGYVKLEQVKAVVQFAEACGGWDKMEEIVGKK